VTDQPPFLNAALAVRTTLSSPDLLTALKQIEVGPLVHRSSDLGVHDEIILPKLYFTPYFLSLALVGICRHLLGEISKAKGGALGLWTWTSSFMGLLASPQTACSCPMQDGRSGIS